MHEEEGTMWLGKNLEILQYYIIIHCLDSDGKVKEPGFSSIQSLPTAFLQSVLPDPTHNNNNVSYFYKNLKNLHTGIRTLRSRDINWFAQSHTGS